MGSLESVKAEMGGSPKAAGLVQEQAVAARDVDVVEEAAEEVAEDDGCPRMVIGAGHCAICGEAPLELHLKARTDRIPKVYRITEENHATCWDLWRCRRCGLIFSDWQLTLEELASLYRRMQDQLYDREDPCRRLTFQRGLALIERYHGGPGRLLDIGCATGIFLDEARRRGWEVAGVDLSGWAVEQARARGLFQVHEGDIYSLLDGGPFDVVAMLDYIEHDPNAGRLVGRVARLLRPGGFLYITSPDISGLAAKLFGSRWWGINPLHLYYFSRDCLTRLLSQHGFEIAVARSYTRVFTVGYWASRLEHFHPALGRAAAALVRGVGVAEWRMPLNLGDMMEVLARRE